MGLGSQAEGEKKWAYKWSIYLVDKAKQFIGGLGETNREGKIWEYIFRKNNT